MKLTLTLLATRLLADPSVLHCAVPRIGAHEILEQQARKKAEKLVRMVQGTSALEAQGVSARHIGQMVKKTVQELLAGSRRRLWAE